MHGGYLENLTTAQVFVIIYLIIILTNIILAVDFTCVFIKCRKKNKSSIYKVSNLEDINQCDNNNKKLPYKFRVLILIILFIVPVLNITITMLFLQSIDKLKEDTKRR